MMARQNETVEPKATRAFYLPQSLLTLVERQAEREGHNNRSLVVSQALREYLARRKAKPEQERVA